MTKRVAVVLIYQSITSPACRQAGILRISKQEVYRLVARRRIPYIRFSIRGIRFRVEDFEEWLRSKTITPGLGRTKD